MNNYENDLKVSVVIPCRNEKKYISDCLDSIIKNDYPKENLEILVVDGMSEDGTRVILESYTSRFPFIKIFNNPDKIIPAAMNIGIRNSSGEILMKMDGHASYEKDYISKCVSYLKQYGAENVGGIWKVLPRENSSRSKAIAQVLITRFGSGNAYIKIGSDKPRWTDCVSFGCFKREVFNRIGLFNEDLIRGSDMDFNKRIINSGGKILLAPDIINSYYCDANFSSFWKHNFSDGVWTTHVIKYGSKAFSLRHLVPLAFICTLIGSALLTIYMLPFVWVFIFFLGIYCLTTIFVSLKIFFSAKDRKLTYLYLLPAAFFVRHFAHGSGALYGLIKPKKFRKK